MPLKKFFYLLTLFLFVVIMINQVFNKIAFKDILKFKETPVELRKYAKEF